MVQISRKNFQEKKLHISSWELKKRWVVECDIPGDQWPQEEPRVERGRGYIHGARAR